MSAWAAAGNHPFGESRLRKERASLTSFPFHHRPFIVLFYFPFLQTPTAQQVRAPPLSLSRRSQASKRNGRGTLNCFPLACSLPDRPAFLLARSLPPMHLPELHRPSMLGRLKSFVSIPSPSAPSTPGTETPPLAGQFTAPLPKPQHLQDLQEQVPCADCADCETDEEVTLEEEHYQSFPKKFDMDQDSEMLGSCSTFLLPFGSLLVGRTAAPSYHHAGHFALPSLTRPPKYFALLQTEPMHRLALISTNKTDWPHDIASDSQSLAFHLGSVHQKKAAPFTKPKGKEIPGVYDSDETGKLTVLASSVEMDQHDGETSVCQFPPSLADLLLLKT